MSRMHPHKYFTKPLRPDHRKYEALRAYFVDGLPQKEVAKCFGYSINTIQAYIRNFRKGQPDFFPEKKRGPKERQTQAATCEKVITLRKQNHSSTDIHEILKREGTKIGTRTIERILNDEGFSKLPRRTKRERKITTKGSILPKRSRIIDFDQLDECVLDCQVAGIYYFIPYMLKLGLHETVEKSKLPDSAKRRG